MNPLCFFGWHKWGRADIDYENASARVFRTFQKCKRCEEVGWLMVGIKYNKITGEVSRI